MLLDSVMELSRITKRSVQEPVLPMLDQVISYLAVLNKKYNGFSFFKIKGGFGIGLGIGAAVATPVI